MIDHRTSTKEMLPAMQNGDYDKTVKGSLYFFDRSDDKPAIQMSEVHSEPNVRIGKFRDIAVTLRDARCLPQKPSLDREGFALGSFETRVSDFYDEDQISDIYYPEIEQFLKSVTSATTVHIFDHTIRVEDQTTRREKAVRLPVATIHNDHTEWSGPKRVRDVMPEADAERYLGHRFTMVNVWRSIGASAERMPLAMADARTIRPDDFVATDLVYQDRKGEIFQVRHSTGQEWYYFPDMQPDEVVLLKCFDNDANCPTRYTAHGAFENPLADRQVPPRESIEVRTMISYAPTTLLVIVNVAGVHFWRRS